MSISKKQLDYINSVFTTKYLSGKLELLELKNYKHHHNMLSNLLIEADIPLVFMGLIMRVNDITSHIPNNTYDILVPTSHDLNAMFKEISSL